MPRSEVPRLLSFSSVISVEMMIMDGTYFFSPSALPCDLGVFLRRMEKGSRESAVAAKKVGELPESTHPRPCALIALCSAGICSLITII